MDVIPAARLAEQSRGKRAFGGVKTAPADAEKRHAVAAALMPRIRGAISAGKPKVGHFDDSATVLEFVGGAELGPLAALGTSCPDHFLRTKIRPLVLPFDPARESVDDLVPLPEVGLSPRLRRAPPGASQFRRRYRESFAIADKLSRLSEISRGERV